MRRLDRTKRSGICLVVVGIVVSLTVALLTSSGHAQGEPRVPTRVEQPVPELFQGLIEEEITIGSHNRLIVEIHGKRNEYKSGDRLQVRWENGEWYINDQLVLPLPEKKRENISVEKVKSRAGQVPMVLRYVKDHEGGRSDEVVWNEAMMAWYDARMAACVEAATLYRELVTGNGSAGKKMGPDQAVEVVAKRLRDKRDLIARVAIRKPSFPQSKARPIRIYWLGEKDGNDVHITLDPKPVIEIPEPQLVSRRRFEGDYLGMLRRLGREGARITIELRDGLIGYMQDPLTDAEEGER